MHPERVRVLDDDDTYLVVAADKGTATFSDTANRVSEERGFWLGDAFASGGSTGYDHKALGITARGAWESVKRHFSELDLDAGDRPVHRGRHRRHVGRRVRQRDAALGPDPARRRLRPPPRVHRPRPRPGRRASPSASGCSTLPGSIVGRLRPRRRSREGGGVWPRAREVDPALAAGARGARRRGRAAGARRRDPRDPARAGRPALERRHRHGGQGLGRDRRRRAGPRLGRDPRRRAPTCAAASSARAATSASRAARGSSTPPAGGLDQRRLHRQLGRRRLLRPRGQPQDPARARRAARRARPARRATRCCATVTDDVVAHVLYDSFLQAQILVPGGRGRPAAGCTPTRT